MKGKPAGGRQASENGQKTQRNPVLSFAGIYENMVPLPTQ